VPKGAIKRKRFHRHSDHVTRSKRWKAVRWQILKRDGFKCVQCGSTYRLQVDHIIPVRSGGDHFGGFNLQVLCGHCHGRKTREEVHGPIDPERERWRDLIKLT
jgi:5-methylcytosine-specific restriction endonuclease McrA